MGNTPATPLPDDFRLGTFEISPDLRLIRGGGRETRIEPKAMAVLTALAGAAPLPLSRDELLQRVWGDQVVREEVLTRCVHQLRTALGDDPRHPELIETIPRQGYRLRLEPEPLPSAAAADSMTAPPAPADAPPPGSTGSRRGRRVPGGLLAGIAVGFAAWALLSTFHGVDGPDAVAPTERPVAAPAQPPKASVAVLPFADLSPGKDQEYLSDGLAEELMNLLSGIRGLTVTSQTSAFSFKGKNATIAEVAETLNVAHVIEGSVRKSDDRVRVTVQLIDAARDIHLWSESWDRTIDDIFAIQDEIAARVIAELEVTLLGQPPSVAETDPEAFNLYLRARYLARATSPKTMAAVDLYEQALAIDPDYAPAWNGLSAFYVTRTFAGLFPWHEGWSMARTAAENALAADPKNARAYALLGKVAARYDVDFEAAARYLEEAYRLSQDEEILTPVAGLLNYLGRTEEAIRIETLLLQRDPVNPKHHHNLGIEYYVIEDFEAAADLFDNALALNPDDSSALFWHAVMACKRDKYQECLDSYEALADLMGDESYLLVGRSVAFYRMGRTEEAAQALTALERDFGREKAFVIAAIHAEQGRKDAALDWLQKRFELEGPSGISTAPNHPEFKALRDNPRYQALLEKAGVSEAQLAAVEFEIDLPE